MASAIQVRIDARDLGDRVQRTIVALNRNVRDGLKFAATIVADRAKTSTLFRGRGQGAGLRGSIRPQEPQGSFEAGTLSVDVTAGGLGGVSYARHVEFGTSGPYEITPKRKSALAFPLRGRAGLVIVKRVMHPGNRARPFMRTALDESRTEIVETMGDLIEAALVEGGF